MVWNPHAGAAMNPIAPQPTLVDQVAEAIISEIVSGELPSNSRLIQDELARAYGVSRHPVQQALLLLRNRGLVREAPGRGLVVPPLDIGFVQNLYEVRATLEGFAARLAAERNSKRAASEGPAYIAAGRAAIKSGSLSDQIEKDMAFHTFMIGLSDNPLIGESTQPHWPYMRRIMAEVLRDHEDSPRDIWDDHVAILDAVSHGQADEAEKLTREHILRAKSLLVQRLQARQQVAATDPRRRIIRR
jgi:DNA-binding GntR family transcriptional regulator